MNKEARSGSVLFDRVVNLDGIESAADDGKIAVGQSSQPSPRERLPKVLASAVVLEAFQVIEPKTSSGSVRQLDDEVDPK